MLLPDPTDQPLPFARFDIFLNEDDLSARFCEFNTDGSSGMNENRETWNSIKDCEPLHRFAQRHRVRDCNPQIFDGWVERFLRIYRSAPGAIEHPHIAVVDFLENSVTEEFKVYARLFEAAGCTFSVYDIRELEFTDGRLRGAKPFIGEANRPIDAIWRRCLAADLLDHWDESAAFVNALRAQAFVLIGSFATNVIHDKQIFDVLARPECTAFLTPEERGFIARTVPATSLLASSHPQLAQIKANPHDWIIKPTDGYGCKDVIPGPDHEDDPGEWATIIDAHVDGRAGAPFLVQRFCHPYRTPAMPFYNREEDFTAPARSYNNLEGLYLIDGEFAGVFCRLGPEALILGRHGGVTAPSLFVDIDG